MLTIEPTYQIRLPQLTTISPIRFSPVVDDDDELTQAIAQSASDHDNDWTLEETPDTDKLDRFWTEVVADVAKDPEWFDFSEE